MARSLASQLHGLFGVGPRAALRILAAHALCSTALLEPASAGPPAATTTPPASAGPPAAATTPPASAGPPAAATTPPAAPAPVPAAASVSATAAAVPTLLTVNKTGLWELGPDLKPVRRLSKSPAMYGRYLPGRQQVLIYGHSGADEQSPVLRLFDRTTQQERVITKLPTSAAPSVFYADAQEERVRLLLQQGRDFCTDGKNACLVLMNRNINMMDETARLTVSLATGKQKLEPLACQPSRDPSAACKRARDSLGGYFCPCSFVDENPPEGKEDGFPYRIKDGAIQQREAGAAWRRTGKLAGFDVESRSPSGRYQLVAGRRDSGDYVYRSLIVFDAQTGELLCPGERRVTRLPSSRIAACPGITATGESEVRWLAGPDRLLLDQTLIDFDPLRAISVGSLVR